MEGSGTYPPTGERREYLEIRSRKSTSAMFASGMSSNLKEPAREGRMSGFKTWSDRLMHAKETHNLVITSWGTLSGQGKPPQIMPCLCCARPPQSANRAVSSHPPERLIHDAFAARSMGTAMTQ